MNPWESAAFVGWVDAVFDHPLSEQAWYWADAFDAFWNEYERPASDTVELLRLLFGHSLPLLTRFSREQVAQAIWFIVGEASPGRLCYALIDETVELESRVRCIQEIRTLFGDLFATACAGLAKHNSEPLHTACYMWWDIFPSWGFRQRREAAVDEACLGVMRETLQIPVEVCQIAALHGLNHWHLHYAADVEMVIDAFLQADGPVSEDVRQYAIAARAGVLK